MVAAYYRLIHILGLRRPRSLVDDNRSTRVRCHGQRTRNVPSARLLEIASRDKRRSQIRRFLDFGSVART